MPENTPQNPNSNKKTRLGRGLGSLLGGAMDMPSVGLDNQPVGVEAPLKTGSPSVAQVARSSPGVSTSTEHRTAGASTVATRMGVSSTAPTATGATHSNPADRVASPASPAPGARPMNEEAQIWMVAIDKLRPNGQQPRQVFTGDGLRDLTASVKEKGILQPIVARRIGEREFEIIAGERRWRAAQAAGLHQVPVILKKVSEQDSLELAIIENIQRENLNPIDEAEAYQHLISDYSMTQQQVADKMGKERSSVANSLRLLGLPADVRSLLKVGELSTGHAKVLLGVDDKDRQIEIAKQVVSEKLSVRATEKLVAKAKTGLRQSGQAEKAVSATIDLSQRVVEALSLELQKLIGTKVGIDYADAKGKIAIHFYSDDQFNQMVEKLRKAWEK